MASFEFYAKLSKDVDEELSPSKIDIIEALAYGYSNKSIANEYGVSIKSVEKAIASLNKKFKADSASYSSRMRIIASLLANDYIDYFVNEPQQKIDNLSEDLQQTLVLSCLGLSNHAIADMLAMTDKCIEKRLGQLFDIFGIDTKHQAVENPRVLLLINAFLRQNIRKEQIKRLYKETELERLERIIKEPEAFIKHIDNKSSHLIG